MGVRGNWRALRAAQVKQLTAHAQMDDKHSVIIERQQEEFATAACCGERSPHETGREIGRRLAPHGPAPEHFDLDDPAPDNHALEPAANRLDFGKLGHLCGGVVALPGLDDL